MAKLDPRLAPAYSIAQAAHYLKIPAPTVRSWVLGRDYPRQSGKGRFKPVVVTPVDPNHRLSFRGLSRPRETEIVPNELLEHKDGKRLESRPSIGAGNRNSELATVAKLNRAKDR